MVVSKAVDYDFLLGPFFGGLTIYPYQLAFGFSFRYWPCIFAPSIRVHVGPFKVWGSISTLFGKEEGRQ